MGYLNYSVEDLLADESFQQYCSGSSREAVLQWSNFLHEHPEMKPTVDEAVKWFMMLSAGQGSSQEQSARLLQRVNANDEISTTRVAAALLIPHAGNKKKSRMRIAVW